MQHFYKFSLLFLLTCFPLGAFAQSDEISIRFIGNCGLHMTDGKTDFYIDFPYKSGAHDYMEYDASEIDNIRQNAVFIFTHRHSDHYSPKLLKKLGGRKFDPWNVDELEKLGESIPEFDIKPFRTQHKVFGISFRHYSYLITWHGKRIFISGDTENADTLASQSNLDWCFAPAWLLADANRKGINLSEMTKMFAVYHIGPKDKITTDGTDARLKLLDKQGERISIPY